MSNKISNHFTEKEMRCKCNNCGHSCPMDFIFLYFLDLVRDEIGNAIEVVSGFRCNNHNIDIGGVKNSWHTKGKAADVWSKYATLNTIAKTAKKYFNEVIIYNDNGFVHIAEPKSSIVMLKNNIGNDAIESSIKILENISKLIT